MITIDKCGCGRILDMYEIDNCLCASCEKIEGNLTDEDYL